MISTGTALIQVLHEDQTIGRLLIADRENRERARGSLLQLATLLTGAAAAGAIAAFLIKDFLSPDSDDLPDESADTGTPTADVSAIEEETEKQVNATIDGLNLGLDPDPGSEPETAKATPIPDRQQAQESQPTATQERAPGGSQNESPTVWSRMKDWFREPRTGKSGSVQEQGEPGTRLDPGTIPQRKAGTARPSERINRILAQQSTDDVGYSVLYSMAGVESTFRPDAGATTSKAKGLFQFLPDTWNYLLKLNPQLGFTLEDRLDPEKATIMAVVYIRMIKAQLKKALGRDPYLVDIYMAYFLGPTGAARFFNAMKADPSQIGARVFTRAASANPGVFYTKGRALTLGQIYEKLSGRLSGYYADARHNERQLPGSGSGSGTGVASASSVSVPVTELAPQDVVQRISPVTIVAGPTPGSPANQQSRRPSGQGSAVDNKTMASGVAAALPVSSPVVSAVPEQAAITNPVQDVTKTNNIKLQTRLPADRPTTADLQTPEQSAQVINASDDTDARHGTFIRRGRAVYRLEHG